jgi:hypothetical protein
LTRLLLDNAFAPLTFNWGFLDAPVDAVGRAYAAWQRRILHRVRIAPLDLPLADALRRLEPLDAGSQRVLFLSTQSPWTACFDNGVRGGNPATFVGELAQRMACRGIACGCIPNTLSARDAGTPGTWGAVKFTLFAPETRARLNIERSLSAINDVRGWEFTALGAPQPFEHPERYSAKRVADRFTPDLLDDYCRALGIRLFDETFYGGRGLLTHASPWFLRRLPTTTLADARRQLGLRDVTGA